MKLSVRLTVLLVTVTVVMAFVVGWFAVNYSTAAQYKVIDAQINAVISSGAGHPVNAVSNATYVVSVNSYDVTLDVIDNHDTVTQVNTGTVPLVARPSLLDVQRSLHGIRTSGDLPGFRYRSEAAAGGSYLVVAASTSAITRAAHHLEGNVALVGLIAALLSVVVAYLFTARDIRLIQRLINFAGSIARDDHVTTPPPESGSPELRELRTSLVTMVGSLHRAIETERRASREMQRFIGDASHELRTPLTVIKGYSEILDRPNLDEPMRRRALERVRREVVRMDALVTDLLFLTEVREAASLPLIPVALSDVVGDALGNFRVDHPRRRVEQRLAPDIWVTGRQEYVERVINNSLSNIARHTPEDAAVAVTLAIRGGRALLTVDDAGPGLPEEGYEREARQFQRFDPARSRESGGTGLGMSIMSDIMTTVRGTMTLGRSPLGGLRLQFEFPTVIAPANSENASLA
ncbi:MAG: HAMP domain-containing histidine kinase [Acidobacteria bacterium]|nr:HAMP domain-containing histidine kinase [Acidobacteriota bacterium]